MNPYACDVVDLFPVDQGDPKMSLASLEVLDQLEFALAVLIGVPHFVIKLITTKLPVDSATTYADQGSIIYT
jgi:hypothetical protein